MEDTLRGSELGAYKTIAMVLILVLMEDTLRVEHKKAMYQIMMS